MLKNVNGDIDIDSITKNILYILKLESSGD